ncbi:MAG: hypothetical protein E7258_00810 [Lachnospiraceae bacterium]|nr:hypothetical protein [Lachnospiraceae bacterium]
MLIKSGFYIIFCGIAGGAVAAGYVAFITLLGVFEKISEKYKASKYVKNVELLIILGVSTANLIQLFQLKIPFGIPGFVIYNFFGGIFTGCLAGALAETLDVFPIISRRFNIRDYWPYIIVIGALGRAIGNVVEALLL